MLLHMTAVLFLVRFNNFALTTGFGWTYSSHLFLYPYALNPGPIPIQVHVIQSPIQLRNPPLDLVLTLTAIWIRSL